MRAKILLERRFLPIFVVQFLSALNDNFLKNALVFLILVALAGEGAALITAAGAIFIAPFVFLSALGGELADRYDKARVARRLKAAEIGVAFLALAGFLTGSIPTLFAALLGFGIVSALFGPIKYAILPDHLETSELPTANAYVEGATFVAILSGTILAGILMSGDGFPLVTASMVVAIGLATYLAATFVPATGEAAPDLAITKNPLASTARMLRELRQDARLWRMGLIVAWFWLVGALALAMLPPLVVGTIGATGLAVTACLVAFSVGIVLGSGLSALLSGGRILLLPVVAAAILMGVFLIDLGLLAARTVPAETPLELATFLSSEVGTRVLVSLLGLAIAGGLFIVPSFAAVQAWARPETRARTIAGVNILSSGFMAASGLAVALLQLAGVEVETILVGLGLANLAVAAVLLRTLPTNLLRETALLLARFFFRIEVVGIENLPPSGTRAVIVPNHVSLLDAPALFATLDRDVLYAVDRTMATRAFVRPFLRFVRALPVDPSSPLATRSLIQAARANETIVVFPEGRLTQTNALMKIYDGAGLIADKADALVVPVRIEGLEKTPFSRLDARFTRKTLFPRVRITVLPPEKLAVSPDLTGRARRRAAGQALADVMARAAFVTRDTSKTVFDAVVAAAREWGPGTIATEDPITGALTYGRILLGARALSGPIARMRGENIGVMLPSSNGAAVTVLATMSAGKVPAMINFTSGLANIEAACTAARVETILTARAFVEKAKLGALVEALGRRVSIVYLEDVRASLGLSDKLSAMRHKWRARVAKRPQDPAAILFTSGSEGVPKGVVLSHANILANAAQVRSRIDFGHQDVLFSALPVFHSFGFTIGTILPIVSGVRTFFYPSPLHYRIIPELVYHKNATILFGTDTFLTGYARVCHPYDFRSLRYVVAGAEPVKETTRRVYAERFGLRILEGYGITETAPVLSVNTPLANRFGTVGRILPGIETRLEPVPGVEDGARLFVRGPNVMLGYLKRDNPGTIEPLPSGWHDTGDIVALDADGYVTIKGRAKRFSKIGGEMISLAAVETLADGLWPGRAHVAVGLPDARKGERIVLLTEQDGASRADLLAFAKARGASEMMVPAEILRVEKVPLLGSGKTDFGAAKALASSLCSKADIETNAA